MGAISSASVKALRERTGLGMMECKKALVETQGDIDRAIENLRKSSGIKAAKKASRTAVEGVVVAKLADDGSYGVLVEVNSETDFAARDDNFLKFANQVIEQAFLNKQADVNKLMVGELEDARARLVQKIGENVNVRRLALLDVSGGVVGSYVHTNHRVAALVALSGGGDATLAKEVAMHVVAANPQVVRAEDMPEALVEQEKAIIKAQPDMAGKPEGIAEKMMMGRINKFLKENSLIDQPFIKAPDMTVGELVKRAGFEVVSFARFEVGSGIEQDDVNFAEEVAAQLKGTTKS